MDDIAKRFSSLTPEQLALLELPTGEGVRVDTGVETGSAVSPYYDPMIAKLITHGRDRAEALERLAHALDATVVVGPHANARFLAALVRHKEFAAGRHDTGFIDRHLAELTQSEPAAEAGVVAVIFSSVTVRAAARSFSYSLFFAYSLFG